MRQKRTIIFVRHRYSRKPFGSKKKSKFKSFALSIAGLIALLFIAVKIIIFTINYRPNNSETNCPEIISRHTILLIDKTTVLDSLHNLALSDLIDNIVSQIAKYEKLSIYPVTDYSNIHLTSIFAACNPGNSANWLYQNPQRIEEIYRIFTRHLAGSQEWISKIASSKRSPIIETLDKLTTLDDFNFNIPHRKLILFSDMIQHSPNYSQYRKPLNLNPENIQLIYPDLSNIEIEVYYLVREELWNTIQGKKHIQFWEYVLNHSGAILLPFKIIR